jgi:hypothetical protein
MGLMNDLFKRGYDFNTATGLKTGANLEDLVTRAVPAASSQLVDQSTLETYADATITDDAGVAINRLRVKDGGITSAKLEAVGLDKLGGAVIAQSNTDFHFSGMTAITAGELDAICTANNTTATAAQSLAATSGATLYTTMPGGAVHRGVFIAKILLNQATSNGSSALSAAPFFTLETTPTIYNSGSYYQPQRATWPSAFPGYGAVCHITNVDGTTYYEHWLVAMFWGKHVGLTINNPHSGANTFKLLRWRVAAEAEDNI